MNMMKMTASALAAAALSATAAADWRADAVDTLTRESDGRQIGRAHV